MKRSELGNEVTEILIHSNRALPVPPLVNDIASALSWLVVASILFDCYPREIYAAAYEAVRAFITMRWGDRIQFAGFQNILSEGYMFVKSNYGDGNVLFRMP